jgi:membrane carboxypeptidase/penicillin-binding protein PbpC
LLPCPGELLALLPGLLPALPPDRPLDCEPYRPGRVQLRQPLGDIPEDVRQAFVSAEDKRFYHHNGID